MNPVKKRISFRPNNFVKITHYACFFECSDKGRENWNALRPRGPFLFRSAGKGSKRGHFARHFGSGKIETREKLFGEPSQTRRFTSSQTHGKVRFCPCRARQGQKSPHEPRSEQSAMLPRPPGSAQRRIKMPVPKPIRNHIFCALFSSLRLYRQAGRADVLMHSGPRPVYSGSGFELSSSVQWNISLKSLKHSGQIQ